MAVCLAPDSGTTVPSSEPPLGRRWRPDRERSSEGPLERDDKVGEAADAEASATTSDGSGTGPLPLARDDVVGGGNMVGRDGSSSESLSSSHLPLGFGVTLHRAAENAAAAAERDWRDLSARPNKHRSQPLKTSGWVEKMVVLSKSGRTVST